MAIYRNVSLTFWTDNKVSDDFTSKDKYLFLYLLTNQHTNIIGCYEVSMKQIANDTGLKEKEVEQLIDRMQNIHKTIIYSKQTKEMFIKNWHRYNWTRSSKLHKPIIESIKKIKDLELKKLIKEIGYQYGIDTSCIDTTDTVSVTVTDTDNINNLYNFITKECNYILTGIPIELNTINLWLEKKVDKRIIKFAFEEAKRRNIKDINYINKIITNVLAEQEKQKVKTDKPLPEWLDKEIKKTEVSQEQKQAMEEILKEYK